MGVDLHRLAAPLIGSSVAIEVMEGLVIGQLLDGTSRDPDALIDGVLNDVARSGRSLLRDGKPLHEPGGEPRAGRRDGAQRVWRGVCRCCGCGVVD